MSSSLTDLSGNRRADNLRVIGQCLHTNLRSRSVLVGRQQASGADLLYRSAVLPIARGSGHGEKPADLKSRSALLAFGTVMRGEGMLKPKKLGGTPGVIRTPDPLLRRPGELGYLVDSAARLAAEKDVQTRSERSSGT